MAERVPRSVLVTADGVGGVFPYAVLLAAGLAARGVRVTLATMGAPLRPSQHAEVERVASAAARRPGGGSIDLRESTFALEWEDDPWSDVEAAGAWLLDLERQIRPDIVHLDGYAHAPLPWRAPRIVVAHSCVASWWRAVHGAPEPDRYRRYRDAVARGIAAADAVVAPTRAMMAAVRELHGEPRRAVVIPNAARPVARARDVAAPFVLAAGRVWDEAKDLALLDRVAPRLGWPVVVAGSDAHPEGGSRRLAHARALGWVAPDELAGWMSRAAVFVHPARYEPFGLAPLEAALHGCPLVLGDIPSLREVWGDAAVYAPPGDADAVVAAVEDLRTDPARRELLGERARARALAFSPERQADAYLALYTSLLGTAVSAAPTTKDLHPCA